MGNDNAPIEFVRIEVRQGNVTYLYEMEPEPDWPVEMKLDLGRDVNDGPPDGQFRTHVGGPLRGDIRLIGKVSKAERATTPGD